MQPILTQMMQRLAGIVLALGLTAGVLWLLTADRPEYQPIAQALLVLGCLAIGWVLGRVMRPLGRSGRRMPITAAAAPAWNDTPGRIWLRGFAAGFWALVALGVAFPLLYDLSIRLPGVGALLLPSTRFLILLLGLLLCIAIPVGTARGMLTDEGDLPRAVPIYAAVAACAGAWSMVIAIWLLLFALQSVSLGSSLADLLSVPTLMVATAGTPLLARGCWPALRGSITVLLVPATLIAAWLLRQLVDGWIGPTVSGTTVLWLLPLGLLWGSSLTSLLVIVSARRRMAHAQDSAPPGRAGLLALGALAFGLLLLLLVPLGAGLLLSGGSGVASAPPPPTPLPGPQQPGTLPVPGPALLDPAPGDSPSGPVWTFRWSPPPGAGPGTLYQFTLRAPGVTPPITHFLTPVPQAQIQLSPATRRLASPWTWRVRVILQGQGAGQWSESRPFTPAPK